MFGHFLELCIKARYLVKHTHEVSCETPIFKGFFRWYMVLCTIFYHLYNLKNVKTPMEEC